MSSRHWAAMGESTFVAGIWVLFIVHRLLGRTVFRALLWPVVLTYWMTRPELRAHSLGYLRRLRPDAGWRQGVAHVRLFAETMLDKLLAMAGRYPMERVQERGADLIHAQARSGRGGVLVTAHMGCLELCQALAERRPDFKVNVLVHTRHAEAFNRILRRLRPQTEVALIEVTDLDMALTLKLAAKVEAGEFIAIAGDRVPVRGSKTVPVPFLGGMADFPVGPYLIAGLLQCPLYLMLSLHEGRGYALEFETLADTVELPRRSREAALAVYAQRFADALTLRLQRSPYDWFNFYAFWDRPRNDAHAAHPV
ncbi:LpxL/LpxP family acyltransferase [Roseateles terrae]|uniref:LPLAT superfamily acyltransferase n=1 Tax=Roseateles terrae TaxID=431060 RepID=A0ABR6GQ52_9BURK|nr:acyltransferase [Roseateles terrae]MBB3194238.1 putative LPLAT superfamily acyltransferase [Roseateles terrae]OWQ88325.1 acyltransferase [Roseateles terrae]